VLVVVAAACGGEASESSPTRTDDAPVVAVMSDAYMAMDLVDPGVIRGSVRFVGTVPSPRAVDVTDDAEACGTVQEVRAVQVGQGGELSNAVVSLTDIERGAALEIPATAPTLDQKGCNFVPHVLLAGAGQPVRVRNSDPLTHNVHTVAFENRSVNRTQPSGAGDMELMFPVAEKVKIQCDLHRWMSAWIVVVDHPYYAITDETGSFVLSNVPPGTYTLEIWHETLGSRTESVTVVPNDTADVRIELTDQG
jgi:plastocyanin